MSKESVITAEGIVSEIMSNAMFRVKLANGSDILAHISGKIRINSIRLLIGDRVTVEISPYDVSKGRIIFRQR
jgi:translation initiation factor IF-1